MVEAFGQALTLPYMQRAFVEILLISVLASAVGVHVVLRRMAFFAEVLQHTIFPGVVVAYLLGTSLLLGAAAAVLCTALLLAFFAARRHTDSDAVMAVLMTAFFGVGVLLISRTSSYQHDLTALLFGRLLAVDGLIVVQTAIVLVIVVSTLALFHKELVFRGFDPEGYAAQGYSASGADLVLRLLVGAVVIVAVQAVGTVMLIAFLVTPALAARNLTNRVSMLFALSVVISIVCATVGLTGSYRLSVQNDISVAPASFIVLLLTAAFGAAACFHYVRFKLARSYRSPAAAAS